VITTGRLDLIPFTVVSARSMLDGTTDATLRWADGFPREDDRDAAQMFLRAPHDVFGSWFILVRDQDGNDGETDRGDEADQDGGGRGEVVGTIGFFGPPDADGVVMVGYGLVAAARQRGYATEALRAVVDHGFAQPAVTRIVADPDLDNVASHRVLEKSGFDRTHSTEQSHWYERRTVARRAG
jgi:RimJ/RimL family protein N-acetyltransferase